MTLSRSPLHDDLVLAAEAIDALANQPRRILPLPPLSLHIQIDVFLRANLEDEVYQVAAMDDASQLPSGFELWEQFLFDLAPKVVRLLAASSKSKLETFLGGVLVPKFPEKP